DDPLYPRIFSRVTSEKNYDIMSSDDFVLHGVAVDEGVKRNSGRVGAKDAPDVIRKSMANFPVINPEFALKDFGNIFCDDGDLEASQNNLSEKVAQVLQKQGKSIVLGGGHEVMFAHYSGIRKAFPTQKIGIINIDAHFDNREVNPQTGPSSGTGFSQIAQQEELHSLHIGIQKNSNTLKLFDMAHQFGMKYILADELFFENLPALYQKTDDFIAEVDILYLTVCMDVFNASVAPGVSATSYNGIFADAAFMHLFRHLVQSHKLLAMDVAEVNPSLDQADITARLAASLINEWLTVLP